MPFKHLRDIEHTAMEKSLLNLMIQVTCSFFSYKNYKTLEEAIALDFHLVSWVKNKTEPKMEFENELIRKLH